MMQNAATTHGKSRVTYPQGQVLIDLAREFKTIKQCGLESVANALDAGATAVWIVDDQRKRKFTVADNGKGMTGPEFEKAFGSVRRTLKKHDKLKYGEDGLGFVSGLGKCDRIRYISHSRRQGGPYLQYVLETEKVRVQDEEVFVPYTVRSDVVHTKDKAAPKDAIRVAWHTLVEFDKYSADSYVHGIESAQAFADAVEERYSVGMRKSKAKVTVVIRRKDGTEDKAEATGKAFKGRRLGVATINKKHAGDTVIDLYLARKSSRGKRGKVMFGRTDNIFRMPLRDVVKTSPGIIPEDIVEGLTSGIFEGEILIEKVERLKNRLGFEETEALVEAFEAVEEWFNDHGRQHLDHEQNQRDSERHQEFAERLLHNLKNLPLLEEVAKFFERGTVGPGHYDPDKFSPVGVQEYKSLSIEGTPGRHPDGHQGGRSEGEPSQERESHRPLTAAGPRGHRRIIVRHGSTGLQIVHDILPGSEKRYDFDPRYGIFTFNVRHPTFQELESSKTKMLQYQSTLVVHALSLEMLPKDWDRSSAELAFEIAIKQHVHQIKSFDFSKWNKKA